MYRVDEPGCLDDDAVDGLIALRRRSKSSNRAPSMSPEASQPRHPGVTVSLLNPGDEAILNRDLTELIDNTAVSACAAI
jgi:hypothetical protein